MKKKEKRKRKAILLFAYIADVSCLTNRSFYIRTLSLIDFFNFFKKIIYILITKSGGSKIEENENNVCKNHCALFKS